MRGRVVSAGGGSLSSPRGLTVAAATVVVATPPPIGGKGTQPSLSNREKKKEAQQKDALRKIMEEKAAEAAVRAKERTARDIQGANERAGIDVLQTLGGVDGQGVSVDVSISDMRRPPLQAGLRRTAVRNVGARVLLVPIEGLDYTDDLGVETAGKNFIDVLVKQIDVMFLNLYPVSPLTRTIMVQDSPYETTPFPARALKSTNRDLDILEREWRLKHYDRFTVALDGPEDASLDYFDDTYTHALSSRRKVHMDIPDPYGSKKEYYVYGGRVGEGRFMIPRTERFFELLRADLQAAPLPLVEIRFTHGRETPPLLLTSVKAHLRLGNRSEYSPLDTFDPFRVHLGCAVSALYNAEVSYNGIGLYRPCRLRMDMTSWKPPMEDIIGDFSRGGKLMKRDVVAAVGDGIASVVFRHQHLLRGADTSGTLLKELLEVRCAQWYSPRPSIPGEVVRVVVELARPGAPFASISIFEEKLPSGGGSKLLLSRRISCTLSGFDNRRMPGQGTLRLAYLQLYYLVNGMVFLV